MELSHQRRENSEIFFQVTSQLSTLQCIPHGTLFNMQESLTTTSVVQLDNKNIQIIH